MLREEEKKEFSMHGAEGSVIYMSDFAAVFGKVRRQYIGNESIYQESLLGPHISRGNSKSYTHTRICACMYACVCREAIVQTASQLDSYVTDAAPPAIRN